MSRIPNDLKNLYSEGRVIPFIGAGVSMSFTWDQNGSQITGPSWSEMVDEAIKMLGFKNPELLRVRGGDLEILEYFRKKKSNLDPLKTWLIQRFSATNEDLKKSPIHNALASMTKSKIFYTTNYDDYLERSLLLSSRSVQVITDAKDMAKNTECEVVKFHGDFNDMEKMVMSTSHYENRLKLSTAVDIKLKADALNRAPLFVGYSFRDWNVAYLFRSINEIFGNLSSTHHGVRGYIVIPDPSNFEIELFKDRNIEIVPVETHDMANSIAALLEELAK